MKRQKKKIDQVYLKNKSLWVRNKILDMAVKSGAGHIAPSFSCVEILVALYYGGILKINPSRPEWQFRDRFILSKGHASIALYPILADLGFFPFSRLESFGENNDYLGVHAENTIQGVEVSTGSLGHGLSIGCGLALAAKINRRKYLTVVLMGDGECHEGSVWEAAGFASAHELNNLVLIIDYNKLSAMGFLKDYQDIAPIEKKWESFGWKSIFVNGHSFDELMLVFSRMRNRKEKRPLVIIAKTVKGKGVSFMENKPIWHYRAPENKELDIAHRELSLGRDDKR